MPHIEWRGGTCRVKWWTGEFTDSGRKRYESKGGFTDEETALDHGRDKEYEVRHGVNITNRDGSTLMPLWLDDWSKALDLAHLTERAYRSSIEHHISPYFKHKTVGEVDVMMIRAFKRHLKTVLAPDSARNVLMVLGMVMADAVKAGMRKATPVEREPRRGKYKKKPREKKKDMPIEVVDRLARNAEIFFGYPGYVFIWTMAMTGMRPSELFGLTREYSYPNWPTSDPEPDGEHCEENPERYGKGDDLMPAIRVQRQVQYEDSKLAFFPPKYESYRTLVVPPFLAEMLDKLLASHDSDWVFPAIEGGCLGAVNFDYVYWRPIADGADERKGPRVRKPRAAIPEVPSLKGKRLYLVRHGHKALLDEDRHSKVAVENRMGHEVPGVEGTYSSVTGPMEESIMELLQARWDGLQERLRSGE